MKEMSENCVLHVLSFKKQKSLVKKKGTLGIYFPQFPKKYWNKRDVKCIADCGVNLKRISNETNDISQSYRTILNPNFTRLA